MSQVARLRQTSIVRDVRAKRPITADIMGRASVALRANGHGALTPLGRGDSAWLVGEAMSSVPKHFSVGACEALPAVADAVDFISTRIAKLPMTVHDVASDGTLTPVEPSESEPDVMVLTRRWDVHTSRIDGLVAYMRSILLHGYAGALVERNETTRRIERIRNIDPLFLSRAMLANGDIEYRYHGVGAMPVLDRNDLLFLPFRPPLDGHTDESPLRKPWAAFRAALAATMFASTYYGRGATPSTGYVKDEGQELSAQQLERDLKAMWRMEDRMRADGRRSTLIPPGWKPVGMGGNASEADVTGERRFGVGEAARVYGLEPILLGDLSDSSYANLKEAKLLAAETLDTWCRRLEAEFSNILWPAGTRVVTFDTATVLRDPFNVRMQGYRTGVEAGVMTRNQARRLESWDESDQEGMDDYDVGGAAQTRLMLESGE